MECPKSDNPLPMLMKLIVVQGGQKAQEYLKYLVLKETNVSLKLRNVFLFTSVQFSNSVVSDFVTP